LFVVNNGVTDSFLQNLGEDKFFNCILAYYRRCRNRKEANLLLCFCSLKDLDRKKVRNVRESLIDIE